MGKSSGKKKPNNKIQPQSDKKPRKDPSLPDPSTISPVWQTGAIDLEGPWGWTGIQQSFFFSNLLPKIQDFETMSWNEILGRNNHEVKIEQISKNAQKRLAALELDDLETLISLRLTGKQRVWGIKIQNVFKILWWDPNHEVYPSKLKHT